MIYAGIGARNTPDDVLKQMWDIGQHLAMKGHTLRSGGADGADTAFEQGHRNMTSDCMEIYLPWKRFNGNPSNLYEPTYEAKSIAQTFHPNWNRLTHSARLFMARNSHQLLGKNLKTKCDFIVCWTPGGKVTGGTGQALRMAAHYQIPVINLFSMSFKEANYEIHRISHHKGD